MMTDVTTTPAIGTKLPLLFNFREALFGSAKVVEVRIENGRALCVQEADGTWMYGVNPGAMAATGEDTVDARRAFREMFSNILKDFVRESDSFEQFRDLVTGFFHDTNPGHEIEWREAVENVRRGLVHVGDLQKASADSRPSVTVEIKELAQVLPADNEADLELAQAA
jgi:hypothetical protein